MIQLEETGMERLTWEVFQGLDHRHTGRRRNTEATTVGRISDQRKVDMRHMHTDLVRTTGFELDPNMGVGTETLKHTVMTDRLLAAFRIPPSASVTMVESLKSFPRQALHARFLELDHPTTGKRMSWESPLPDDFVWLLTLLKQDREAFIG